MEYDCSGDEAVEDLVVAGADSDSLPHRLLLWLGSEPHVLLVETSDSTDRKVDAIAPIGEAEVAFVKAPSGLAGFLLVTRLPGWRPRNMRDAQGRWVVRVRLPDASAVRALIERVQAWMRQERIAETSVSVGTDVYRVGVDHADLETSTEGSE